MLDARFSQSYLNTLQLRLPAIAGLLVFFAVDAMDIEHVGY